MDTVTRIDDCLSIRDGRLYVEACDTVELIRRFGSPLFVFSEDQIRRNVHRFQEAFQEGWSDGPVKILPAAKANWISAIQRVLADEDCGCDVYCYGDRLMPIVPIPEVEVEDILALLDTGAYQEVSMSNFNAIPRPASVLVTGDRAAFIRQGESGEDVLRRDRIPDHLRREEETRTVTHERPREVVAKQPGSRP